MKQNNVILKNSYTYSPETGQFKYIIDNRKEIRSLLEDGYEIFSHSQSSSSIKSSHRLSGGDSEILSFVNEIYILKKRNLFKGEL